MGQTLATTRGNITLIVRLAPTPTTGCTLTLPTINRHLAQHVLRNGTGAATVEAMEASAHAVCHHMSISYIITTYHANLARIFLLNVSGAGAQQSA